MKALEMGALETLLLYEELDVNRFLLKNPVKGETKVVYLNTAQQKDTKHFKDQATGVALESVEEET